MFGGQLTYNLFNSNIRSCRNKLLCTWTTTYVFINLNLSKVTSKCLPKMSCFTSPMSSQQQ